MDEDEALLGAEGVAEQGLHHHMRLQYLKRISTLRKASKSSTKMTSKQWGSWSYITRYCHYKWFGRWHALRDSIGLNFAESSRLSGHTHQKRFLEAVLDDQDSSEAIMLVPTLVCPSVTWEWSRFFVIHMMPSSDVTRFTADLLALWDTYANRAVRIELNCGLLVLPSAFLHD